MPDIKIDIHNEELPIPSKDFRPAVRVLPKEISHILNERSALFDFKLQIFDAMRHWHEHGDITVTLVS
jgi:hypothetical protein